MAYVTPAANAMPSPAAIIDWLRERLPEYMLPSAIVTLAEFPRTPNGKVDRAALPAPPSELGAAGGGAVEARLAGIMASVLHVEGASDGHNFLYAGGNPLLGALVIDRVRQAFGVTLTPNQLFEVPTISGLAAEIERAALVSNSAK